MVAPSIPAELIALLDAGDGYAVFTDPATNRKLELRDPSRLRLPLEPESDDELRAMLDEARRDITEGRVSTRTTDEFLAEMHRRHGATP